MRPLYFTGRARNAAKQILDHTSLGGRLSDDLTDDGTVLEVHATVELVESLSRGEVAMYDVLASLAGDDTASLYRLATDVDELNAFCAWWALGILLDKVVPVAPVDFAGLASAVGRSS